MVHLCLGGGSIRGFAILGALNYLYMTNKIKKIHKLHACSVGSVIGVLIIIGQTPREIFDYLLKQDFKKYWDFDIGRISSHGSILGDSIFNFFREYLSLFIDPNITISEFSKVYDVDLNVITTCINTMNSVIINKDTLGDTPLIDALCASSSIPFLFAPFKIGKYYYIDGACRSMAGCLSKTINENTVVIKLSDEREEQENFVFDNIKNYVYFILKTILTNDVKISSKYCLMLDIPKKFSGKFSFNDFTNSDKTELFFHGMKQSRTIFANTEFIDSQD